MTRLNWHFPPIHLLYPREAAPHLGSCSKPSFGSYIFRPSWRNFFFCPFFGNVFQLKDDLRIFSPVDKNKVTRPGYCTWESWASRIPFKMEESSCVRSSDFWLFFFLNFDLNNWHFQTLLPFLGAKSPSRWWVPLGFYEVSLLPFGPPEPKHLLFRGL